MATDFQRALEQERQQLGRRIEESLGEEISVQQITEYQCLDGFQDELSEIWDRQGEAVAAREAARRVFASYVNAYMDAAVQFFEDKVLPEVLPMVSILGVERFAEVLRNPEKPPELQQPAVRWLLSEGIERLAGVQRALRITTLEALGRLVRVCDHHMSMLEAVRDLEDDDWVYDILDLLQVQLQGHGLLRTQDSKALEKQTRKLIETQEPYGERGQQYSTTSNRRIPTASGSTRQPLAA